MAAGSKRKVSHSHSSSSSCSGCGTGRAVAAAGKQQLQMANLCSSHQQQQAIHPILGYACKQGQPNLTGQMTAEVRHVSCGLCCSAVQVWPDA